MHKWLNWHHAKMYIKEDEFVGMLSDVYVLIIGVKIQSALRVYCLLDVALIISQSHLE